MSPPVHAFSTLTLNIFFINVFFQALKHRVFFFRVNLVFGTITCLGGAFGITLAVYLSRTLRGRFKRVDPAICAGGLLVGVPFILGAVMFADSHPLTTWVFFFFGLTFLSLNWSIVPDILLYTVLPTRRGTASAMQILFSHMLGDAASPYIVGSVSAMFPCISDILSPFRVDSTLTTTRTTKTRPTIAIINNSNNKNRHQKSVSSIPHLTCRLIHPSQISDALCTNCTVTKDPELLFTSLRDAMLLPVAILLVGAVVFVLNIFTIVRDKKRCQMQMQGNNVAYKLYVKLI